MTERRMDLRVPVELPARLETPGHGLHGMLENLSFQGACVRLPVATAPFEPAIDVYIRLKPSGPSLALPGSVVSTKHSRIRVAFGPYGRAADFRLTGLLEEALRLSRRRAAAELHIGR